MTDKEKIKFWTKGRLFEIMNGIGENDAKNILTDLLSFIDSMQEEPVSKDYRERYKRIAQYEAFKKTHEGMSIGEVIPIEGEINIPQVFDEGYWERLGEDPVSDNSEEAAKEWLRPQLDKSYANYGEAKMMELTHFDGYAMLDAIEFGVKWQKEKDEHLIWQLSLANYEKGIEEGKKQMMKDAVDTTIAAAPIIGLHINIKCNPEQFRFGDKVKVFVIKED